MNQLKYIGLRGQGYFCDVKKYLDESTGNKFALKELKKSHYAKDEYRYRFDKEISIIKELQGCENIIDLLESGHDTDKKRLWYLMPLANYNLYEYIKSNNANITKETKYNFVEQVINAIKYAHSKSILHRDISPNNVLVSECEGRVILKVSDFGLGKDSESLSNYTASSASGYGHILYVAPEQRNRLRDATNKSDIYSMGKLVYFIFTGKDPDTLKPFELSTLVTKAIDENPENRFSTIGEFESHFISLKELQLNQTIDTKHLTLNDIVNMPGDKNWIQLHEFLVAGNYIDHVFSDYINPVNNLILEGNNLKTYYANVGNAIRDFVNTYSNRLDECYRTVRWPFSSMSVFGSVLIHIIKIVEDDESRLICLKQLWYLAFNADQWSVQSRIKEVFNNQFISSAIETQLSVFIIQSETKIKMTHFDGVQLPNIVRSSMIKGNEIAEKKEEERRIKLNLNVDGIEW